MRSKKLSLKKEAGIKKILFVVFDGLADRPIPELGDKTPLEAANIPNINLLAKNGICGLQNAMGNAPYPTSEEAHCALFGYNWKTDLPGRGVLEALGQGVDLKKNELVLRINFASVDSGLNVIDPHGGNISSVNSLCEFIGYQKIGSFVFRLYPGKAHRGVLVISGPLVSEAISHGTEVVSDTDPHKAKEHRGGTDVLIPQPLNRSAGAKLTAEVLRQYQLLTYKMLDNFIENRVRRRSGDLPANFILTRGAGYIKDVPSFQNRFSLKAACVAGYPIYKGVGKYFGMDVIDAPGKATLEDDNFKEKINTALSLINREYGFVFVHFKGTDMIAEDYGDYERKKKYLEKADPSFKNLLNFDGIICVTGDHATPCVLKDHAPDPVPIMIIGGKKDKVNEFNEKSCKEGALGHMVGKQIMPYLIKEAKNV